MKRKRLTYLKHLLQQCEICCQKFVLASSWISQAYVTLAMLQFQLVIYFFFLVKQQEIVLTDVNDKELDDELVKQRDTILFYRKNRTYTALAVLVLTLYAEKEFKIKIDMEVDIVPHVNILVSMQ